MTYLGNSSALMTSVSISMPVGSSPDKQHPNLNFLAPFPVNQATSAPARNAAGEWPLQPNHSGPRFNAVVLPNVRCVGLGSRRWNVRTSYTNNTFTITLIPNKKPDAAGVPAYWDINQYRDLGIVMEGVQVNCMEFEQIFPQEMPDHIPWYYDGPGYSTWTYSIPVVEKYWNASSKSAQTLNSTTKVAVYGVDVTKSVITPPYKGSRGNLPVPGRGGGGSLP